MSFLGKVWQGYLNALEKWALPTKCLTAGSLLFGGDLIGQHVIERKEQWDIPRTLRMAGLGLFFTGPTLHFWYGFVNRLIPGSSASSVIKKVALDQLMIGPFILAGFFTINSVLSGDSLDQTKLKLRKDYWSALKMNWKVWPAAMLINFKFVPVNLQVGYVSSVALVWNIYLSVIANQGRQQEGV